MNINDLDKVKKVEAPTFLLTRIQQKIENLKEGSLSKKSSWILALSFVVIVGLNIGLIIKNQMNSQSIEKYAQAINLTSNNNLYK